MKVSKMLCLQQVTCRPWYWSPQTSRQVEHELKWLEIQKLVVFDLGQPLPFILYATLLFSIGVITWKTLRSTIKKIYMYNNKSLLCTLFSSSKLALTLILHLIGLHHHPLSHLGWKYELHTTPPLSHRLS